MEVKGETARHLGLSLRKAVGDRIGVAGSDGRCGEAVITRITNETVSLELQEMSEPAEPPVDIWLAQALPKGDKMDLIVQKSVELGVKGVYPLQTAHCIVRYDMAKQSEKLRRWQKVAKEAAQQCGRSIVPIIGPFVTMESLFQLVMPKTRVLTLYEGKGSYGLKSILKQASIESLLLMVGPEGGFSIPEAEYCQFRGAILTGLGNRILRTETAGLAALSAIMYEYGDLGGTE